HHPVARLLRLVDRPRLRRARRAARRRCRRVTPTRELRPRVADSDGVLATSSSYRGLVRAVGFGNYRAVTNGCKLAFARTLGRYGGERLPGYAARHGRPG